MSNLYRKDQLQVARTVFIVPLANLLHNTLHCPKDHVSPSLPLDASVFHAAHECSMEADSRSGILADVADYLPRLPLDAWLSPGIKGDISRNE